MKVYTYTGSQSQNDWMIAEMKKNGFKKGGTIGKLIDKTGEDGFVLARTGEEILSEDKVKALSKVAEMLNQKNFNPENYDPDMSLWSNNTNNMVKEPAFTRIAETNQNRIDNVNVNMNFPNAHNADDIINVLERNSDQIVNILVRNKRYEKVSQEMTLGQALGHNKYNKYRI